MYNTFFIFQLKGKNHNSASFLTLLREIKIREELIFDVFNDQIVFNTTTYRFVCKIGVPF